MLDGESELQDLFIHRQYSEGASFIILLKPQCLESYRVLHNDRRITLQAYFSGQEERRKREVNN